MSKLQNRFFALLFTLIITTSLCPSAEAGVCSWISHIWEIALGRGEVIIRNHDETAVEIEMDLGASIKLLDTSSGAVGDLYAYNKMSDKMREHLEESYPQQLRKAEGDVLNLSFRELEEHDRMSLIIEASKRNSLMSFFKDRVIPGLVVRDTVRVNMRQEGIFFGETLKPGPHELNLKDRFTREIHFRSPDDALSLRGTELHLRAKGAAESPLYSAWSLQHGLGVKLTHLHQHQPAYIAKNAKRKAELGMDMASSFREGNTMAEMVSVVEGRSSIHHRTSKDNPEIENFSSLGLQQFSKVIEFYQLAVKGIKSSMDSAEAKMAYLGLRNFGTYDNAELYGWEYRSINFRTAAINIALSKTFKGELLRGERGEIREEFSEWWLNSAKKKKQTLSDTLYNRSWERLKADLPEGLAKFESLIDQITQNPRSAEEGGEKTALGDSYFREIKMLFHDWSRDPVLFKNRATLHPKILAAQTEALNSVKELNLTDILVPGEGIEANTKYQAELNGIIRTFLLESGLYLEYASRFKAASVVSKS